MQNTKKNKVVSSRNLVTPAVLRAWNKRQTNTKNPRINQSYVNTYLQSRNTAYGYIPQNRFRAASELNLNVLQKSYGPHIGPNIIRVGKLNRNIPFNGARTKSTMTLNHPFHYSGSLSPHVATINRFPDKWIAPNKQRFEQLRGNVLYSRLNKHLQNRTYRTLLNNAFNAHQIRQHGTATQRLPPKIVDTIILKSMFNPNLKLKSAVSSRGNPRRNHKYYITAGSAKTKKYKNT